MAALSGSTIASTFSELLRMGNSTLHATTGYYIKDAADTNSALSIAITRVGIGTTTPAVQLDIEDTTASSATQGGSLRLGSNDGAVMASGHRLGVIEFVGAEDTNSTMTVGAKIEAVTDDTWSDTENGASLDFYTVHSDQTIGKHVSISSIGQTKFQSGTNFAAQTAGMVEMKDDGGNDPVLFVWSDRDNKDMSGMRIQAGKDSPVDTGDCVYIDFTDGDGTDRGFLGFTSGSPTVPALLATSDERLKKDIIDTETNGLYIINGLELKDFSLKECYSGREEKVTCDFIAQNAEEYFPAMVGQKLMLPKEQYRQDWIDAGLEAVALETADGVKNKFRVKTVSAGSLIPILVKAVQELSAKVTALENA